MRAPLALALLLALLPFAADAAESGSTHYVPGGMATLIDLAPTKPGFVVETMYLHYEADASRSLPVARQVAAGLDVELDSLLLGALYTLEPKVLGARYTAGAFLPWVWMEAEATVSTGMGSISRRDEISDFGDVLLLPAMLAWEIDYWQLNAVLPIYAPSGDYERGRLANAGLNYWTFDPTLGLSYNHDELGFNAAAHAGLSFNTENERTDYESGTEFHLDASVQQLLPVGPGFLGLGAELFWLDQIEGDSGSGATFGGFEGHTFGVGPALTYVLPVGESTFVAEARWLPEIDVKRRVEGDYFWLKLVYQF